MTVVEIWNNLTKVTEIHFKARGKKKAKELALSLLAVYMNLKPSVLIDTFQPIKIEQYVQSLNFLFEDEKYILIIAGRLDYIIMAKLNIPYSVNLKDRIVIECDNEPRIDLEEGKVLLKSFEHYVQFINFKIDVITEEIPLFFGWILGYPVIYKTSSEYHGSLSNIDLVLTELKIAIVGYKLEINLYSFSYPKSLESYAIPVVQRWKSLMEDKLAQFKNKIEFFFNSKIVNYPSIVL